MQLTNMLAKIFISFWLAVIRQKKRAQWNVTASLQLNYIIIIFTLILTLVHENIGDCNSLKYSSLWLYGSLV